MSAVTCPDCSGTFESGTGHACPRPPECATCGEAFGPNDARAEVYDAEGILEPVAILVHADTCIPAGYEVA
jgi:hypothetical protein